MHFQAIAVLSLVLERSALDTVAGQRIHWTRFQRSERTPEQQKRLPCSRFRLNRSALDTVAGAMFVNEFGNGFQRINSSAVNALQSDCCALACP